MPNFPSLPHPPNSPSPISFLSVRPTVSLLPAYLHQKDDRALPGNLQSNKVCWLPLVIIIIIIILVPLTAPPFSLFFSDFVSTFRLRKLHMFILSITRQSLVGRRCRKAHNQELSAWSGQTAEITPLQQALNRTSLQCCILVADFARKCSCALNTSGHELPFEGSSAICNACSNGHTGVWKDPNY